MIFIRYLLGYNHLQLSTNTVAFPLCHLKPPDPQSVKSRQRFQQRHDLFLRRARSRRLIISIVLLHPTSAHTAEFVGTF